MRNYKIVHTKKMKNIDRLHTRIEKELHGLSFESNDRNILSAALFDVAIEHSKSVILLLKSSLFASSYALARPMFESFVRAAWIQHCASDEQLSKLKKKDAFPLNFKQMIEAVEQKQDWIETLSKIKKAAIKNMHSYTHGGMQIIVRRFKDGELCHPPDKKEIDEIIRFAALITFLSFNQIAAIAKTTEKDIAIKEMYDDICQWCFPKT